MNSQGRVRSTRAALAKAPSDERPREFHVALPRPLRRFAASVTASVIGPQDAEVVILLGGISANRFPCMAADGSPGWWSDFTAPGCAADPAKVRVLGIDFAADETGNTAPSTVDQAAVVCAVLDEIGVDRAAAIIGASYGGMVALSLAQHFPQRVARIVVVSAPAEAHPMATATRELQRRIVAFAAANKAGPEGLALARGLAMLTYRSPEEFEQRFVGGIDGEDALGRSEPGAYLYARGQAFRATMSPGRFISLSASIDRHQVDPAAIFTRALFIGSATDQLVPPSQMTALASRYGGPASLRILPSLYGHDMFLKEAERISELALPFLKVSQ